MNSLRTVVTLGATLAALALTALGPVAAAGPALAAPAVPGTLAAPGSPAGAEPMNDCTTTRGVVVAVDFAHFGGPVLRSCSSTPATGYDLLNQGGWRTTGTEHDGPGFICRIGYAGYHGGTQYPTPSQQACVLTPPYSAYWAFWYANRGQNTWSYSQAGAMSTNAQPGSVELWVFGGTSVGGTSGSAVPSVSPGSLRATNTGKLATVQNPSTPQQTTTAPRETSPASGAARPAPTGSNRASATPSGRATIVDAPPTTASGPAGHGSARPALIALVIVLALAAAGIVAVLRRPRRER
jgi:hypothetical protein